MKTKTTSNPGPLSRALFTSLLAIAAACLSVGTAWTAHAQSPSPSPNLFASVNGTGKNGGGSIFQYTPTTPTVQSTLASGLDRPRGLVFDSFGNLFVSTNTRGAGGTQGSILKITPGGLMSTFATGFPLGFFLAQLALDSHGNVFVDAANENDSHLASTIYEVTPGGTVSAFGLQSDCIQSDGTNCSVPSSGPGLAIDSSGNIFAMSGSETNPTIDPMVTPLPPAIYMFTTTPAVVRRLFAGSTTFPSGQGPVGLACDTFRNLFVSTGDLSLSGNGEILEFAPDGTESTSPFATGLTHFPKGLAFDAGNLFVAEIPGDTTGDILEFSPGGTATIPGIVPASGGVAYFASGIGLTGTGNSGPEFLAFPPPTATVATSVTTAVTLTFPNATAALTTTVTSIDQNSVPPPPSNFELENSNLAFEITTTVAPTPPIIIAFQVPSSLDVSTFKALHYECDTQNPPYCNWVDRTIYPGDPNYPSSPAPNTIYASVSSLSPFVVAKSRFSAQVKQPINADGSSVFSVKRGVVPVTFTLTSNGVATCQLPPATISLIRTAGAAPGPIDESTYLLASDNGSNFRISNCQYIYNLATSSLGTGTYKVKILIGGTVVGSGTFGLK